LNDVLLQLRPSLPGLRRKLPSLVRSVHRYYGAVRLLQRVRVRRAAMCLHGPAFVHYRRRAGDLPVLVHVVSQRARVLRLRRTGQPLASNAAAVLPSSYSSGSRHPDLAFFEAQSPRSPMPRSTLRKTPRDVPRKTRGRDGVAFSFPVLHPLQHAGSSRRTTRNALRSLVTCGVSSALSQRFADFAQVDFRREMRPMAFVGPGALPSAFRGEPNLRFACRPARSSTCLGRSHA